MKIKYLFSLMLVLAISAVGYSQSVSKCSGDQLSLKALGGESDMGGKRYENYVFKNISSTSCTISGYPRIVLLTKSGKVIRGVRSFNNWTPIGSNGKSGKRPSVTLKPNQTAWFQIFYQNGFGYDLKRPVASSAKIKVTVPNTTKTFVIKSEIQAYKEMQISAVQRGLPN